MSACSRISKLYGMKNIITEEVMEKIDTFQAIFGKVDEFGWWGMERIQTDAVMQFISREFQEGLYVREARLSLAEPDHHEINGQVEVSDKYIHFY